MHKPFQVAGAPTHHSARPFCRARFLADVTHQAVFAPHQLDLSSLAASSHGDVSDRAYPPLAVSPRRVESSHIESSLPKATHPSRLACRSPFRAAPRQAMPTTQAEPLLLDTPCLATPCHFDSPSPAIPSRPAYPLLSQSTSRAQPCQADSPDLTFPTPIDMPSPVRSALLGFAPVHCDMPGPRHPSRDYPSPSATRLLDLPSPPRAAAGHAMPPRRVKPSRVSPTGHASPCRPIGFPFPESDMPSLPQRQTAFTPRRASPRLARPTCHRRSSRFRTPIRLAMPSPVQTDRLVRLGGGRVDS